MTLVAFVDSLQRQAVDQVAFYPRSALQGAIDRDEVRVAFENGEPCGYLWHGPMRPGRDAVIYQAVIHYDLRRRLHGARLVVDVADRADKAGCAGIRCRCRSDVEANDFWYFLGFRVVSVQPGGKRRGAEINVWRRPILDGLWDDLIVSSSSVAANRSAYDREYRAGTLVSPSRFAR
jgi:hypothetical protein